MKHLLYKSLKIAFGVVLAIFVAEIIGLKYSTTAGVIAMLGILDNRRQTYIVGLKRIVTAFIAMILIYVLFYFGGHNLWMFGLFIILFVPIITWMKVSEGLSVSTVLVTHIYSFRILSLELMVNEISLLIIGVGIAWVMNLHMPDFELEIRHLQQRTEEVIKDVLHKMKRQLLNQCSVEEQEDLLNQLRVFIEKGKEKAYIYQNNYILKDRSYFIKYFQMRQEQYQILVHMEKSLHTIFSSLNEANIISNFTEKLALELNECNDGNELLIEIIRMKNYYKTIELPETRESFENRATLYQYLNDLEYFVEIKSKFIRDVGDIRYCHSGLIGRKNI